MHTLRKCMLLNHAKTSSKYLYMLILVILDSSKRLKHLPCYQMLHMIFTGFIEDYHAPFPFDKYRTFTGIGLLMHYTV